MTQMYFKNTLPKKPTIEPTFYPLDDRICVVCGDTFKPVTVNNIICMKFSCKAKSGKRATTKHYKKKVKKADQPNVNLLSYRDRPMPEWAATDEESC